MKKTEAIIWETFKNILLQHPDRDLQFRYAEGKLVDAAYHITEIKQAPITSVDCGGIINNWTEIIIQLWVPETDQYRQPMKVGKALTIIDLVEKMLPLNSDGIVKIEFGNSEFDTRQMFPNKFIIEGNSLIIDLLPDAVQCKAQTHGDKCGTNDEMASCCALADEKPKIKLLNQTTQQEACCTGGSCC